MIQAAPSAYALRAMLGKPSYALPPAFPYSLAPTW
jgi:hypothetical protein